MPESHAAKPSEASNLGKSTYISAFHRKNYKTKSIFAMSCSQNPCSSTPEASLEGPGPGRGQIPSRKGSRPSFHSVSLSFWPSNPCRNTQTCTHPLHWKPAHANTRLQGKLKHGVYLKASQKRTGQGGQRKAATIIIYILSWRLGMARGWPNCCGCPMKPSH